MATEKTPVRSNTPDVEPATAVDEANGSKTPAEAIHELGGALGRAWHEARDSVSDIGSKLGQRARNVRDETREAASETRETLQDAIDDMGELGQEVAEDAIELGRAVGVSVSKFVRQHPMRSLAIAAVAGAFAAHLLRRRGR
jgi:ElaB/YqjD/DUF883 family membrane-anchored ribosome-binding protein